MRNTPTKPTAKESSAKLGTASTFLPSRSIDVTVRFSFDRGYGVKLLSVKTWGEVAEEVIADLTDDEERHLESKIYYDLIHLWGPSFAKLDGTYSPRLSPA